GMREPGERPIRDRIVERGEERRADWTAEVRDRLERVRRHELELSSLLERLESDEPLAEIARDLPGFMRERGPEGFEGRPGDGRLPRPEEGGPGMGQDPEHILNRIREYDQAMYEKLAALRDKDPEALREFLDKYRDRIRTIIEKNPGVLEQRVKGRRLEAALRDAAEQGDRVEARRLVEQLFDVRAAQMAGEIDMLAQRLEELRDQAAAIAADRERFIDARLDEAMRGEAPAESPRRRPD
ncbi:MAG: hypothetical protein KDA21_04665, partial [Phycisphaerales bacterium]|nr:hypothetical protein [Phycisphaerales bacterium]